MGIRNPEVLYTNGCREIVEGDICGRQEDHPVHGAFGDHQYRD